ncbi:vesicle transport protein USE1 [Microplitis demolitor]|uniref:vesicle transport protein USE1 n=1 Tax=Microplitis demolitor TaxID=69319 RepID=UPI0006D4E05F|nr:vesicle transport protein USE1 [Microplitis demolitor]
MTQQNSIRMSRSEINVRRLLGRCELLAKEDSHQDWRLEKYINALDDAIKKLQTLPDKPSGDKMMDYTKRIDFLKRVIDAGKFSNPIERVVAAQMLPRSSSVLVDSTGPNIVAQIHQKTSAKYNKELRSELFNTDSDDVGIRHRLSSASPTQDEDLDALIKYNRNMQEIIAENMLLMTSNMKEHALTANAIIKKDMSSLEKSDKLTEINAVKLNKESLKLEEHTKSKWRCLVWVMIAFVLAVFFNMVLFMKVAKKKI